MLFKARVLTATLTNSGTVIQGINIRRENTQQLIFFARTAGQFSKKNCQYFKMTALLC